MNALEKVHESIMTRRNVSYSLRMDIMRNCDKRAVAKAYSEKNTDPGKDRFGRCKRLRTGCQKTVMCKMNEVLASPIPSPSVAENVNRIWIIGSNHAISLSSPLRILLKACSCPRKTFKMAWGFWQVSSCAAKGWVSRRFPVNLWYSFVAASNIAVKLSVEGPAV